MYQKGERERVPPTDLLLSHFYPFKPSIEFERERERLEELRMCEAIRWNKRDPLGGARFMEGFNLKNLWFSLMEYA